MKVTLHVSLLLMAVAASSTSLPAVSGDENWDNRFGIPPNGFINAVAVDGTNLYIGGYFTDVGGIGATNIARWDGRQWHSLGSGVNDVVQVIAVKEGVVYAGGSFANAGTTAVNGVARWDGTNWLALGSGVSVAPSNLGNNGTGANALAFLGSDLYVGGSFSAAGGQTANGFARWDGAGWQSYVTFENFAFTNIGVGLVHALTVMNGQLYIGGSFQFWNSDATVITNVARFNGTAFSSLPNPPKFGNFPGGGYDVFALATDGTRLFAGGQFSQAGGLAANNVAQWDGSTWSSLGLGVNGTVRALTVAGGLLYAGSGYLAQWTGTQWVTNAADPAAGGGSIYALASDGPGALLAAGSINNRIVRQGSGQWTGLGLGLSGGAQLGEAFATDGTNVYLGGRFTFAGGVAGPNIIWWDGTAYHSIGGANNDVLALALWNGDLYAGGSFSSIGGVAANEIARWDGTNWHALGSGVSSGTINAFLATGTNFYAGGSFQSIGGITAHAIARWDGSAWRNVGASQAFFYGTIYTLGWYNNQLIAGGNFGFGAVGNDIAQWNGSAWSALGSGVAGSGGFSQGIHAVAPLGTNLLAGGSFATAGGKSSLNLATWNGSAWATNYADNPVFCLAALNGSVFAGGFFTNINGVRANAIARWDGNAWWPLGSGLGITVNYSSLYAYAMMPVRNDLLVAGSFGLAGENPSAGMALWHGNPPFAPSISLAALTRSQVLLSWPSSASGYNLQTSTNLEAGANWTTVNGAVISGDKWLLTNAISGAAAFFRLHP